MNYIDAKSKFGIENDAQILIRFEFKNYKKTYHS